MNKRHELLINNDKINQNYLYWFENKGIYSKLAVNAAADGSVLHQLLLKDKINLHDFSAGFAFIKLYTLVMRSKGIKNRLRTYCQNWENINGIAHDNFCSVKLESLWNNLLMILIQENAHKNLLLELAMPSQYFDYSVSQIKDALAFLHNFWKACKNTKYCKQAKSLLNIKPLLKLT